MSGQAADGCSAGGGALCLTGQPDIAKNFEASAAVVVVDFDFAAKLTKLPNAQRPRYARRRRARALRHAPQ